MYQAEEHNMSKLPTLLATLNYDESKVPALKLPQSLRFQDGTPVDTADQWPRRRAEIIELFKQYVYGTPYPTLPPEITHVEEDSAALNGTATRIQLQLRFRSQASPVLHLLVYLPNHVSPAPCFLGLNFFGNHTVSTDPSIIVSDAWMRAALTADAQPHFVNHRALESGRGLYSNRWPLEQIIGRGYGLATLYYGDIHPDFEHHKSLGIHPLFNPTDHPTTTSNGGAISAWAWGLSRAMDALETIDRIDQHKVCLTGHSRLGKTSLWAGALDERFALIVSNNSGCGGASLNRRNFGETLHMLSQIRTHWFCDYCLQHSQDMEAIPVDQHQLIAALAPRPVFISSAQEDPGADPKGEFLGARYADDVYRLLGQDGIAATEQPPLNQPLLSRIGYYIRPGKHDITPQDWAVHLDFADRQL